MTKVLSKIKQFIIYFFGGVVFALFVVLVIFVGFIYYENNNLKKEVSEIKSKLVALELKIQSFEEAAANVVLENDNVILGPIPVYNEINWAKLRANMQVDEVVSLLGNPNQIISKIDTTRYIYRDEDSEGNIYFNRRMRIISWNRPQ